MCKCFIIVHVFTFLIVIESTWTSNYGVLRSNCLTPILKNGVNLIKQALPGRVSTKSVQKDKLQAGKASFLAILDFLALLQLKVFLYICKDNLLVLSSETRFVISKQLTLVQLKTIRGRGFTWWVLSKLFTNITHLHRRSILWHEQENPRKESTEAEKLCKSCWAHHRKTLVA